MVFWSLVSPVFANSHFGFWRRRTESSFQMHQHHTHYDHQHGDGCIVLRGILSWEELETIGDSCGELVMERIGEGWKDC